MSRPLVGIIGNAYIIHDDYPVQAAGVHNIEAVSKLADATSLIVPSLPCANDIDHLVDALDGFVFTGAGPNVHPEEYGEPETEAHGIFNRDRDRTTLPLLRACVERGVPVLGICRGFQEFNVAFGGTLHPEIRDLPGRDNHRMPPDGTLAEKFALRHEIRLTKGGRFEELFGADVVMTNSLHGQGICKAGPRVVVEGWASDGTPEAIYIKDASSFAMAVQWHPEWNATTDAVSQPLFRAFGKALPRG